LRDESKRIVENYPQVISAGPSASYDRIDVKVDAEKSIQAESRISSEIPLGVTSSKGGTVPLSRTADGMPYSGGAGIYNSDSGAICSTGFAVWTSLGQQAMLTTRHCTTPGKASTWTPALSDNVYGYESTRDMATDSMLLLGQGLTYGPLVYGGDWQSGFGYPVNDWGDPFIGEYVCDSGGYSGEMCPARVVFTDSFISGSDGGSGPGYVTDNSSDAYHGSAGEGDSGGASFTVRGDAVVATGTIVAGYLDSEAPCSPGAMELPRLCFHTVFHNNIEAVIDALNVTPMWR
jgi:hypothetical protein